VALVGGAAGVKCSASVVLGGIVPFQKRIPDSSCVQKNRFSERGFSRDFITKIH
jgi:hypothetical protein